MGNDAVVAAALEEWFQQNARDLPWRRKRDGYRALVSESMLQQTQVSRVIDSFDAFMRRFPTIDALAAADEQDVLAAWRGLGYYRRARNLHAAARMIVSQFGGRVPDDVEQLLRLPGVGRYTAGAIASIVHNRAAPIVDGNIARVLARLDAVDLPPRSREAVAHSWKRSQELVNAASRPGALNEAMMELGAVICAPRGGSGGSPRCAECPIAKWCEARKQGRQDAIPPARVAAKKWIVHFHTVVIRRGDLILLEQRGEPPDAGLWSRMWQTPTIESDERLSDAEIAIRLPWRIEAIRDAFDFVHHTTHREVRFHVFTGTSRMRRGSWRSLDELDALPMSNPQRRIIEQTCAQHVAVRQ